MISMQTMLPTGRYHQHRLGRSYSSLPFLLRPMEQDQPEESRRRQEGSQNTNMSSDVEYSVGVTANAITEIVTPKNSNPFRRVISLPSNMNTMGATITRQPPCVEAPFQPEETCLLTRSTTCCVYTYNYTQDNGDANKAVTRVNDADKAKETNTETTESNANTTNTNINNDDANDSELIYLMQTQHWEAVERLCEERPDLARKTVTIVFQGEKLKVFPLFFACSMTTTGNSVPLSVIGALVTAYPSGLFQAESKRGLLPIHMTAIKGDASLAVVRYLVRAFPQSLYSNDKDGNLPIHQAAMAMGGNANNILSFLSTQKISHCINTCGISNSKRKLPLHLVCAQWEDNDNQTFFTEAMIRQVMETYPEAIVSHDHQERLPLHVACSVASPRLTLIAMLLAARPETVLHRDGANHTPLQIVTRHLDKCSSKSRNAKKNNSNPVVSILQEYSSRERKKQSVVQRLFGHMAHVKYSRSPRSKTFKKSGTPLEHWYVTKFYR